MRYQFLIYLKLDFLECKEAHHCALSKHCPSLQKKTKKFGKNGVNIENLNKQYKNVLKKKPTWIEIFCTIFFWGHNNRYVTIFVYKQLGKENNSGAAYTVYV